MSEVASFPEQNRAAAAPEAAEAGRELLALALSDGGAAPSSLLEAAGATAHVQRLRASWRFAALPPGLDGKTARLHLRQHALRGGDYQLKLKRAVPHPDRSGRALVLMERRAGGGSSALPFTYIVQGSSLSEVQAVFSAAEAQVPWELRVAGMVGIMGGETVSAATAEAALVAAAGMGLVSEASVLVTVDAVNQDVRQKALTTGEGAAALQRLYRAQGIPAGEQEGMLQSLLSASAEEYSQLCSALGLPALEPRVDDVVATLVRADAFLKQQAGAA